jgi:hypothetical protein
MATERTATIEALDGINGPIVFEVEPPHVAQQEGAKAQELLGVRYEVEAEKVYKKFLLLPPGATPTVTRADLKRVAAYAADFLMATALNESGYDDNTRYLACMDAARELVELGAKAAAIKPELGERWGVDPDDDDLTDIADEAEGE